MDSLITRDSRNRETRTRLLCDAHRHFLYVNQEMFKPFKPPLLKSVKKSTVDLTEPDSDPEFPQSRPNKKRRLIHVVEDSPPPSKAPPYSSLAVNATRKPLLVVKNPVETKTSSDHSSEGLEGYYMVLWYGLQTLGIIMNSNLYYQAEIHD